MSSSSPPPPPPHVFVNFRGKDIRLNFMAHLFNGLGKANISYFRDDNRDDAGKEIKDKLLKAIHQARIALIVFSANYADSIWCLNELVEILKCNRDRENPKLVVIPIFHIGTAEVSKWANHGEFEKALKSVEMEKRDAKKVEWRAALKWAKGITGYELNTHARDEAELVTITVERLLKEIASLDSAKSAIPRTPSVEVFGPFGGKGEKSWEFDDIKGIVVHCADFIKSITFKVDDATSSKPQTIYDACGRENTFKVKLENGEYITSFAGYFNAYSNPILINSLAFRTNKRILGPIGREQGEYFSSISEEARKVIGFFGKSGDCLESIGARATPHYPFKSVGLFGWAGGSKWDEQCAHTNVRYIILELDSSGDRFIRSITFQYENGNNELSQSKTHGGNDGNRLKERIQTEKIDISRDEYLTSISGYTYQPDEEQIGGIRSLTFQTNKRTIRPIGDEKGRHFSSPATGGKIVGFYGWSDEHLYGIGAYFEPISPYPIKSIGPFGSLGGKAWDNEKFYGVRRVTVRHNDHIGCIITVYDIDGKESRTIIHGDSTWENYPKIGEVTLDYPTEYLTSISGYMREDCAVIQSLTFYSSRKSYGPFGKEMGKGKYFWYPSTGSKIIGFHGRCGETLNAIGVYAQPIQEMSRFKTDGPFGDSSGTPWDDGVHTDVRGFHISFSDVIHSIRIMYDNNGSFVLGSKHGERGNYGCEKVMLDYPKERLLSISGWMGRNGHPGQTIIHNLQIYTTKTHYGPFIPKSWSKQVKLFGPDTWKKLNDALGKLTKFHIPSEADGGRIVGFLGRAGSHLNSIRARLEP